MLLLYSFLFLFCTFYIIQMFPEITRGRLLTGPRFHTLIYLHAFTDCFMKISPQSLEQRQLILCIEV